MNSPCKSRGTRSEAPASVNRRSTDGVSPTRRGRNNRRNPPCPREGCFRHVRRPGYTHCCRECGAVDVLISSAEGLCREHVDLPEKGTALWLAAVELNDALTAFFRARTDLLAGGGREYRGNA